MKRDDFVDMFRRVLNVMKQTARFVWRHFLTLASIGLLFAAFAMYPTIDWEMFFIEFFSAVVLDWVKMRMKSGDKYHHPVMHYPDNCRFESISPQAAYTPVWDINPTRINSPAWNANPSNFGSSSYYASRVHNY